MLFCLDVRIIKLTMVSAFAILYIRSFRRSKGIIVFDGSRNRRCHMLKGFQKIYLGICLILFLLFTGCSDAGDISRGQELESNQNTVSSQETESGQKTESSQETSAESAQSLIRYEVEA